MSDSDRFLQGRRSPMRTLGALAVLAIASALGPCGAGGADAPAAVKKLNPYTGNPDAIKEGRTLYLESGCSGCHGVMGGGGMGVPLLDDVWKFGSDDETLFKLITGEIPEATMPKVFRAVLSDEQVWKILAYVRSLYKGDPAKVNW
jgi:cytochrome c(L)